MVTRVIAWWVSVSFSVAGLTAWSGCSPSNDASPPSVSRGFIGVLGAGRDDPFWPVLCSSALRSKPELGATGLVVAAPETASVSGQMRLVDRMRRDGMRGLCIQVIDPAATEPLLRRLINEGVAVVTMMQPVPGLEPNMHCGLDELRMGESMADLVAEALHERGTVAVLHANSVLPYSHERYQAFIARMRTFAQLTILREFDCGGDPVRARETMQQCMERYPRLNAWVALDNWPLRGLKSSPLLPATCKLVTADPNPLVWDALADGRCHAMVGAAYDEIAPQAVERCATALQGKMVRWTTYFARPRPIWAANFHAYKLDWIKWCSTRPEN